MSLLDQDRASQPARSIRLIPVGPLDAGLLEGLAAPLASRFHIPAEPGESLTLRRTWFDDQRRQYRADPILDALIERGRPADWSLGILDADLFVPGLTFIFGQATVGGCCAIIALERLRAEPVDPNRFQRRILTEATHELGHIAGLDHCPNRACVMSFSSTIEESDDKGPDFCERCVSAMQSTGRRTRA